MSRATYDQDLAEIRADIIRMGNLALDMVELAVQSALNDDKDMAGRVADMEENMDHSEQALADKVLLVMVRESPVAKDLLFLSSTLAVVGELEKAGDDAAKLARRSFKLKIEFPDDLKHELSAMDQQTRSNFRMALQLYTQYSPDAAHELIKSDTTVDNQYKASRRKLLDMMVEQPENKRQLFRCGEIFHALEHIADHAANIARTMNMFYQKYAG
jgi:phosphate transport system protein